MMRFICASDSFKGSLSSEKIGEIVLEATKEVFPDSSCKSIIVSDGGEGFLSAVKAVKGGKFVRVKVKDALSRDITAKYLTVEDIAVIAVSEVVGLELLSPDERNPLLTSSYGVGQLVFDAVKKGYKKILVALGGSSTCDGGIGALMALGVGFEDENGAPLRGVGEDLEKIRKISLKNAPDLDGIDLTMLCDVQNVLLGERGASLVFARQKGADENAVRRLEDGMKNFAKIASEMMKKSVDFAGGGAAGGIGFAFKTFFNAKIESGIDYILNLNDFDNELKNADLVISGEGKLDAQTGEGKVVAGIAERCKKNNKPLIIIAGGIGEDVGPLYEKGVTAAFSIANRPMDLSESVKNAEKLYYLSVKNVLRTIKVCEACKK